MDLPLPQDPIKLELLLRHEEQHFDHLLASLRRLVDAAATSHSRICAIKQALIEDEDRTDTVWIGPEE